MVNFFGLCFDAFVSTTNVCWGKRRDIELSKKEENDESFERFLT
jgi:hypothetical protein